EDRRLLMGNGSFVDDIQRRGMLHAAFVRSPLGSATITNIDTSATTESDGVHAALTADDLELTGLTAILERDEVTPTTMPVLATNQVRYAGEPVVLVAAADPYAAEDGTEHVLVDYEPRQPVTTMDEALASSATPVHEELQQNTFLDLTPFPDDEIDEVFD